jgi:cell division protein ZapA
MSAVKKTVSVRILDKDYQVACSEEEERMLLMSARHLDSTMRNIRSSGKVIGSDRIAVMAALNVTNELLHGGGATVDPGQQERISKLGQSIDNVLQRCQQSEP